jgi:hypothetical protein
MAQSQHCAKIVQLRLRSPTGQPQNSPFYLKLRIQRHYGVERLRQAHPPLAVILNEQPAPLGHSSCSLPPEPFNVGKMTLISMHK